MGYKRIVFPLNPVLYSPSPILVTLIKEFDTWKAFNEDLEEKQISKAYVQDVHSLKKTHPPEISRAQRTLLGFVFSSVATAARRHIEDWLTLPFWKELCKR